MRDGSINYGVAFILFGKFYSYEKVNLQQIENHKGVKVVLYSLHYEEGLFMISG